MSAALRPSLRHPHVERAVVAEREAAIGLVDLHRRDADIECDAVERTEAETRRDGLEIGESVLDQGQPVPELIHKFSTAGDGGRVAIEREHAGSGVGEDRLGIAAGAERPVEVEAGRIIATEPECGKDLLPEHGNVGWSASSAAIRRILVAAAHHSRAPGGRGVSAACLELSCFRRSRRRSLASSRCA